MAQVVEDQTPATRNRHSHRNVTLLWRESKNAAHCVKEEEEEWPAESEMQHSDSKEEHQEELESTSCPTDASQMGGPAQCKHLAAPDGGWGWVVLVAVILVRSLVAFPFCISIFYRDLQTEFNTSNTETSWVQAFMAGMLYSGGPLCSMFLERFGCRATVMAGGLLSGLGMVVSSLARTITEVYISSIITGLGLCFSFQPSVTIIGHYFERRRVFVNALSSTGTAVGLSVLPLVANTLLSRFGRRGAFLILGGMLLNCCVCGAVMRQTASASKKPRHSLGTNKPNNLSLQRRTKGLKGSMKNVLNDFTAFLHRHLAFDQLVSNAYYCAFTVGVTWSSLTGMVPLVYLVPFATLHSTTDRAAFLMSVHGLVNIAAGPTTALVFSRPCCRGRDRGTYVYMFAVALLVNGLSNCICGVSTSYEALLVYVVIFSLSLSACMSLLYTVLMSTVEMSRFPSALGLLSMLQGGMLLIGPPLAGMLLDHTGQYSYVFYTCSVCIFSAGLFIAGSFYILDSRQNKKKEKNTRTSSNVCQGPVVFLAADNQCATSQGRRSESVVYVSSV